ncbi:MULTISPECIES: ATP-binding protein [unclassified Lysinibacillus]|uniref:HAMP domain-containing sensor histidine kinase n=1 Tax=unclassified Lysinibacillus TaxID=2636778 RepID=UPI003808091D
MYLKTWMKKWLQAMFVCLFLIYGCFSYLFFINSTSPKEPNNINVINQIRLNVNHLLIYIEDHFSNLEQDTNLQSSLQAMSNSQKIDVIVSQLDGKVIFSSIKKDSPTYINLKNDLHYDLYTSKQDQGIIKIAFPIINEETKSQIGNAIFTMDESLIPISQSSSNNITIIIIISCLSLLFLALIYCIIYKTKKDILYPIDNIKKSTEQIVRGNYEQKADYTKSDEIGDLYAVFEQMRLEILNLNKQRDIQELNQKKLISTISHDVKTPLTTIKAYLDAIADGICPDKESMMTYIHIMQTNTEKMSRLIDDLFIHTLKELGHIPVNLKEQYCGTLFANILRPFSHYVQTNGIQFIEPTDIPNVLIRVDEQRLEQVLSNLITNALKHTSPGDSITVSIDIENHLIKIMVIDTGKGMRPQDMPFIFERYFRGVHPTEETAVKNDGAGLGLSICKHIIEAHNGTISFTSKQNEGTAFTLLLPIC